LTEGGLSRISSMRNSSLGKVIHDFLYDRWYINALYYKAIVGSFSWLSRNVFKYFDSLIIDGFYHILIPKLTELFSYFGFKYFETEVVDDTYHERVVRGFTSLGSFLRRMQTGLVNHYLTIFVLGLLVVLLLIIWVG